jgi:hypothetical protein
MTKTKSTCGAKAVTTTTSSTHALPKLSLADYMSMVKTYGGVPTKAASSK